MHQCSLPHCFMSFFLSWCYFYLGVIYFLIAHFLQWTCILLYSDLPLWNRALNCSLLSSLQSTATRSSIYCYIAYCNEGAEMKSAVCWWDWISFVLRVVLLKGCTTDNYSLLTILLSTTLLFFAAFWKSFATYYKIDCSGPWTHLPQNVTLSWTFLRRLDQKQIFTTSYEKCYNNVQAKNSCYGRVNTHLYGGLVSCM